MPSLSEMGPRNIGAHPFDTSPKARSHWGEVTAGHSLKRAIESLSTAEVEPVRDTFTPLVQSGRVSRFLGRIGSAFRRAAPPAVATEIALGAGTVAIVMTVTQPETPVEASSNVMLLKEGSKSGITCIEDGDAILNGNPLLVVDPEYARKLASGEVLVAVGGAPVAAVGGEGEKIAAINPIPPDEAWQNLVKPADKCKLKKPVESSPPRTETPTPVPMIPEKQFHRDIDRIFRNEENSDPVRFGPLSKRIIKYYETHPAALGYYKMNISNDPQHEIDLCIEGKGERESDILASRIAGCLDVGGGLLQGYIDLSDHNPQAYELWKDWFTYLVNEPDFPDSFKKAIFENFKKVKLNSNS